MSKQLFRDIMAERRQWPRGSADYEYRTRAARTYLLMHLKVPTTQWKGTNE